MRWHSLLLFLFGHITGIVHAFRIEFSVVELFEENPRDVLFLFLASKRNSVDNLRTLAKVFRVPTINYILPHALMDEWDEETVEELKHNLLPYPELHEILLPCVALYNRPILANEFFKSPSMYTYGDNLADCNVEYQKDIHPETYLAMLKWILTNIPKGKWSSLSWQWMVTWRLPNDIRKQMITLLLPYMDAPVIDHLVKNHCLVFRECLYDRMSKDQSGEMEATLFGVIQSASLLSRRHMEKLRLLLFSIIRVSPHLTRDDHFLRHMWKWIEAQRNGWKDIFTFWQAAMWAFKVARDHPHCGSEIPLELILSAYSKHDPFVFNLDVQRVFAQVSLTHVRPELVQSFVEQVRYPNCRSNNWYQEFVANPDSRYLPPWNRSLPWRINKWREAVICACSADLFYINTEALSGHPVSFNEVLGLLLENVMVYDNLPSFTDHDAPITPHIQRHFTHPITFDGKEFYQFRGLLIHFMVNVFPKASELGWLITVGPQETCISNLALLSLTISSWSFLLWEGQSMLDYNQLGLCMEVRPDSTFTQLSRMLSLLYCEWLDDDAFPKIIEEKFLERYHYSDCFSAYELYGLVTGGIKI